MVIIEWFFKKFCFLATVTSLAPVCLARTEQKRTTNLLRCGMLMRHQEVAWVTDTKEAFVTVSYKRPRGTKVWVDVSLYLAI